MPADAFLGLDFGTGGARACIIAPGGEIEEFTRLDFGVPDDPALARVWRDALADLVAGLPAGLRKRLAAVAVDGTSGTVLACDQEGNPVHPPLLYRDDRARAEAMAVGEVTGVDHPTASPTSGLAKMLWLRQHLPAARGHRFLNQADWLAGLLCDAPCLTDYHNALKMGFDPASRKWPGWMDRLLERATLPRVVAPGSPIGRVARPAARRLGIPGECLVRAGTTDSTAAFIATGARRVGEAVTSLGTTLVLKQLSDERIDDGASGVYSHWFGRLWLVGGASNSGGGALRQFFSDAELAELSGRIDAESDSGLDYYPLPRPGERFPVRDPDLPGRMEPRPADRTRFLHGLLEGLARIEAMGYGKLAELGAPAATRVLSCGGGSRNLVYTRLRERRLGVPVEPASHAEAAYGTALLARHGVELFPGDTDV